MTEKEAWLDEPTWEQLKHEAFEVLNNPKLQRADILAIGREPTYLSFVRIIGQWYPLIFRLLKYIFT